MDSSKKQNPDEKAYLINLVMGKVTDRDYADKSLYDRSRLYTVHLHKNIIDNMGVDKAVDKVLAKLKEIILTEIKIQE